MRLKQIKLAGFKSFVDPTKLPFLKPLTAIIGPNGCGKSNTIDAVRWVLGESSAKNLRGDAMTDVIFNGSTARRPVSVASVELVFENLDGRLGGQYANYQEISVKRQVTRDGESSYFLNGQKCRRKDITDLFMGTGLGPRSYAIIEQGTISRLIESKPHELRVFIEEAAGISRYKERRKDTENRIRHTRENLERLGDIRLELGNQLEKLSTQAQAAKHYREYKQQERQTHAELLVMRYQDLTQQTEMLSGQLADQELMLAKVQADKEEISKTLTQEQLKVEELERREQDLVQCFYQTGTEVARLEQQLTHEQQKDASTKKSLQKIAERRNVITEQQHQLAIKLAELNTASQPLIPQQQILQESIEELEMRLEALGSDKEALDNSLQLSRSQESDLRLQKALCQSKQEHDANSLAQKQAQVAELHTMLAQLDANTEVSLSELSSKVTDLTKTVEHKSTVTQKLTEQQALLQTQLDEIGTGKTQLEQQRAANLSRQELVRSLLEKASGDKNIPKLWQTLEVTPGWEAAVELLLDSLLNMSVVSQQGDVDGFYDCEYSTQIAQFSSPVNLAPWLGNLRWEKSKEAALQQISRLAPDERIITADGYLLGQGFILKKNDTGTSVVALQNELQALETELGSLDEQLARLTGEFFPLKQHISQINTELDDARNQYQTDKLELARSEQNLLAERNRLDTEQQRREEKRQKVTKLEADIAELTLLLESHTERNEQLDTQLDILIQENQQQLGGQQHLVGQLKDIKGQVSEQQRQCHQIEKQLSELNTQIALGEQQQAQYSNNLAELAQSETELNAQQTQDDPLGAMAIQKLQAKLATSLETQTVQQNNLEQIRAEQHHWQQQLEISLLKQKQEVGKIEGLVQRIGECKLKREGFKGQADAQMQLLVEAQIRLDEVVKAIEPEANSDLWQKKLDALRSKIGRLGAINLAAIEEYEQQSERKAYLDNQDEDLNKALQSLEEAIRKIDRETRSRFKATFEQINTDFGNLFPKVFGGGHAYLALTDDDLLETGVSIMARPPGKKNSTIHLLSGGEKALTALSLVFAIFRLNPAPFCMLDEVDAPLDDANVERFCRLLKEMSQTVQFIYISHNKITMEMAEQLVGVTMHEPGVSRIVAVDLEEAVAMADAE